MTLGPWRFNIRCLAHVLQSRRQSETIAFQLVARHGGNWRFNIYLLTLQLWHFCPIHPCLSQKRMKAWPQRERGKNSFHHSNQDHLSYVIPSNVNDYKFHWNRKFRFLLSCRKGERNHSSLSARDARLAFLLHWQSKTNEFDPKVDPYCQSPFYTFYM